MKSLFFWILIGAMIFSFAGIALAETSEEELYGVSEAKIEPEKVKGNPLSGDGADNHKVEGPEEGEEGTKEIPCDVELDDLGSDYPDTSENEIIEVHWQISDDGKELSWQSEDEVAQAVVKGGNSANVYYYYDDEGNYLGLWDAENGLWYDSGLVAPKNPGGQDSDISNFGFFANCPEEENGTNGNGTNGNGTNGNDTNGPPPVGNGVTRTSTPRAEVSLPEEVKATPVSLPATGGNPFLFLMGLGLLLTGIITIKK